MQTFKKLLFLLSTDERKRFGTLILMITIMALFDMIGVASILPFMAVLTNASLIDTNFFLNYLYKTSIIFGIENKQQFIFALGILVFIILVLSLAFKTLTTYLQVKFVEMREYTISKRLVEGYLHQPYSWFLGQNSSELGKTILSEVTQLISNAIRPLMELISKGMITIALIILLILVDPKLAVTVGFALGGAYGLIFYFVSKYLNRYGNLRLKNNEIRFKSVSEAFGATKEVKVGRLEQNYIKKFSNAALIFAKMHSYTQIISQLPRFILEAIGFGGMLLIMLYLLSQTGNFNSLIPILSLYVFAGYRMLPALQSIYTSMTMLTFSGPSLNKIYNDLKNLREFNENQNVEILSFNQAISLKNVHYNYPDSSRKSLNNISLTIPAKSTIGLVGATGSGKTTTVDVILGLLEAQKGSLEVDGKIITKKNSRSWQRSIGYVPQHIYLSDNTILENIAFGEKIKNVNYEQVEKVSKIANLYEFVINELPEKYNTIIGERGVRLSGGQRQRIGIARALYHNPQILILDEATSALDNQTEKVVMDAVDNFDKDITIIMIAHRLNTVKNCDKIFLLEKGELKNEGTFEELIELNENFRKNININ